MDKLTKQERYDVIAEQHEDTEAELAFKVLLDNNNIKYKQEVQFNQYRADFVINGVLYEINGGYHYSTEQRKKDKKRATYLLKHFGVEIKEIRNEAVFMCKRKEIKLEQLLEIDMRCIKEKFKPTRDKSSRLEKKPLPKATQDRLEAMKEKQREWGRERRKREAAWQKKFKKAICKKASKRFNKEE